MTLRGPLTLREIPSLVIPVVNLCLLLALTIAPFVTPGRVMPVAMLTAAGFTGFALLRTLRMARRTRANRWLVEWPPNFVVACVYELGRALALVARATHRTRRDVAVEAA